MRGGKGKVREGSKGRGVWFLLVVGVCRELGCNHAVMYALSHTDLSDAGSKEVLASVQNLDCCWKDTFVFFGFVQSGR